MTVMFPKVVCDTYRAGSYCRFTAEHASEGVLGVGGVA